MYLEIRKIPLLLGYIKVTLSTLLFTFDESLPVNSFSLHFHLHRCVSSMIALSSTYVPNRAYCPGYTRWSIRCNFLGTGHYGSVYSTIKRGINYKRNSGMGMDITF